MTHEFTHTHEEGFVARNITAIVVSTLITAAVTLGTLLTFAPLMHY